MSEEPDFLRQVELADFDSPGEARAWIDARLAAMKELGCTFHRATWDEQRGLLLIEGWKVAPRHQGEPRFNDPRLDDPPHGRSGLKTQIAR